MKNLMMCAAVLFASLAMVSCAVVPEGGNENENTDVTFSVAVVSAGEGVATVTVSHNGAETDTWYGFVTTDTKKSDLSLVYEKVAEVTAEDLLTGVSKTIELTDLELDTNYKYVAFGVKEDGSVYGTAGSAPFKTDDGKSMTVNADWTIEYAAKMEGVDENGQPVVATNCLIATVAEGDTSTYFLDYMSVEDWASTKDNLYNYVADGIIPSLKAYIAKYNQSYGTNYTWDALLNSGNTQAVLGNDIYPGQYVAYMVGINADESVARVYAYTEFEVVEGEPTAEYSAWLGTWTAAGEGSTYIPAENPEAEGTYEDGPISFDITISHALNNCFYYLDGWTNVTGCPILVEYYADYDALILYADAIATGVDFGEDGTGTIYLLAEVIEGGEAMIYTGLEAYIMNTESGRMLVGGDYSDYDLELYSMGLYVQFDNDPNGYVYPLSNITPYFPLALTPAAAAEAPAKVSTMGYKVDKTEGKKLNTFGVKPYTVGGRKFSF
ncbi:MAG: hypothetical protein J6U53_04875 [Tidjanibacter sp.]|nr:hypothetical protein [Tidjanibacter sp.]